MHRGLRQAEGTGTVSRRWPRIQTILLVVCTFVVLSCTGLLYPVVPNPMGALVVGGLVALIFALFALISYLGEGDEPS